MSDPLAVYDLVVIAILIGLVLNGVLNLLYFPSVKRREVKGSWKHEKPKVSVLIPARNEAHQIAECLRAFQDQTYDRYEVMVLDDCSEDGTAEVVRQEGFSESLHSPFRLIKGQPLPRDWAGKPWACYQLSRQATGDYLLFADADTVHAKDSIESIVALALRRQTHLLSVWPRQKTVTWSEKLVIPLVYMMVLMLLPLWAITQAQRTPFFFRWFPKSWWRLFGAANGQCLLFTRDAYKQLGSHQLVKNHLVEDLALGQAVSARTLKGWKLLNADGKDFVSCRMYRQFMDVWEGFSKNVRPAFERRLVLFLAVGILLLVTTILPFVWFLAREERWLIFLQLQLVLLLRLMFTVRFETSWLSVLLHPFSVLLGMGIALNSWWLSASGAITWKRRQYEWPPTDENEAGPTNPAS